MNLNKNIFPSEIPFINIIYFFKGSYKLISFFCIFGFLTAVVYLFITPKQYQASAQIRMAQIISDSNRLNSPGVNAEEPSTLISRLSFPTSYPPEILVICGLHGDKGDHGLLSKFIKFSIPKNVPNVVDLRVFAASPEVATSCAKSIFGLIQSTQAEINGLYIEEAKSKLADTEQRLIKIKDLIAKADRTNSAISAVYLSTRDEIGFLLNKITELNNFINYGEKNTSRLVAPIYASETPIAPKRLVAFQAGLFGGLFLGIIFSLIKKVFLTNRRKTYS